MQNHQNNGHQPIESSKEVNSYSSPISLQGAIEIINERCEHCNETKHDVNFSCFTSKMMSGEQQDSLREIRLTCEDQQIKESNGSTNETTLSEYDSSIKDAFANESNSISMSCLYGIINAAIVLPVMMSFGSIIYNDEFFRPYLPVLVKLTVISACIHQVIFSTFSSLPFAVGQVQDAGLIFLSSMASDIVKYCREREYDDEHILATVTIGLSLCTAILGVGLILIGKCRLASYVQKLPTPVVGGYLAFIGFFCGQSGMAMMAGVSVEKISQWGKFFNHDALMLLLPGVLGGIMVYLLVTNLRHMAVLPTCIVALIVVFYSILSLTGTSIEEARQEGWVSQANAPPVWYKTWNYLQFDKVVWSALPQLSLTLTGMIFVVALSSSLDIAAIELDLGKPLNYDHEIKTVGLSNMVSGLTGGYTGSYIFSQTIFSLRSGIRSRLCGFVVAATELVSVILPISILSFLPNFFFGSLLVMICVDLMYEWLWDVRKKTTNAEYFVALGTFVFIQIVGVEYGILAGLGLYLILWKIGFNVGQSCKTEEDVDEETIPIAENGSSTVNVDYGGMGEVSPISAGMNGSHGDSKTRKVVAHESLV